VGGGVKAREWLVKGGGEFKRSANTSHTNTFGRLEIMWKVECEKDTLVNMYWLL
jgi:hypothetical protein